MKEKRSVSINFDELRSEHLVSMYQAMRPFLQKLADIDTLQDSLEHMESIVRPSKRLSSLAEEPQPIRKPKAKGTYREKTQREAVKDVLAKKPGATLREVTTDMIAGGYPFASQNPTQPVGQTLRAMVLDNEVRAEKNAGEIKGRFFLRSAA